MSDPARHHTGTGGAPLTGARAADLLDRLRRAHEDLLDALRALEDVTGAGGGDRSRYPHARWRLSSARRKRRSVAAEIHAILPSAVTSHEAAALERLRADDDRRLSASALHVQRWTSERIAEDWAGYCAASAPMRAALRDWVAAERALLYPLLERCAARA